MKEFFFFLPFFFFFLVCVVEKNTITKHNLDSIMETTAARFGSAVHDIPELTWLVTGSELLTI